MTMKMISDKDRQQAETTGLVTARDLRRVFWRSFQMEFSPNYERQMNLGVRLYAHSGIKETV